MITAARHADELAGLILLYPALLIEDDSISADMYTKPVLILNEDKDKIEQAVKTYTDSEFHIIRNRKHETFAQAVSYIKAYFRKIGLMPGGLSKIIPVGTYNTIAGEHFTGKSFLYPLSTQQVGVFNVTFEPGCYNEWHTHFASEGGGQILIAISGRG